MKKIKKIIACALVIVMVFSMVNVAFASTPAGGINDVHYAGFDVKNGGWRFDVYLSDNFVKSLVDKYQIYGDFSTAYNDISFLLNPSPKSMAMRIVDNFNSLKFLNDPLVKLALDFTSPEAFIKSLAKKWLEKNIANAGRINQGNGIIIRVYPLVLGADRAEPQPGPAVPVAERVQITVTVSPNEGGRTAGGGSILKYVATANNRLTRVQLNAYPNSGWQFDGWYEGGTLVGSNTTFSFDAERNRTLEARFKRQGQSSTQPSTPQTQPTVRSIVEGDFTVTIPANYTLDCFRTPTATTRYTWVAARSSSYPIYCTKRLTMSDGSTRYFFVSGNNNECYFVFTNAMSVDERGASALTQSPTAPTPPPSSNVAIGSIKSVISSASQCTFAIKKDGSLWGWGRAHWGQMGDGNGISFIQDPVKIMDSVISVSAGQDTVYAIKSDGSLWGWGLNTVGQLGNGKKDANTPSTPIKIMDDVEYVSGGYCRAFAIKKDGSLWGWGWNNGTGFGIDATEDILTPVKIMDSVAQVTSGEANTLVLKKDGSLWSWGWGCIGDGSNGSSVPVKILDSVKYIYSNGIEGASSFAITTDNSLWAWGNNKNGRLGDGTTEYRSTPVKVMDDVRLVSSAGGAGGNTLIIKTDGSLWACGFNGHGQLGDGTFEDRHTPVKITDNVLSASTGAESSFFIKNDGSVWGMGYSDERLGVQPTETYSPTPVKIMDINSN